jgi:hypothetical protein
LLYYEFFLLQDKYNIGVLTVNISTAAKFAKNQLSLDSTVFYTSV